jgi:hypothetical protein
MCILSSSNCFIECTKKNNIKKFLLWNYTRVGLHNTEISSTQPKPNYKLETKASIVWLIQKKIIKGSCLPNTFCGK